ncbi:MAG: DUF5685 family protein [Eubacteriales bacterium]
MFGYVTVHKPEMKMKDFAKYKAYYCGLCHTLKDQYGLTGQITLNYDMTFAIVLLSSLYEVEGAHGTSRCIVHPIKKHELLQNEITEYAAAMNVILAYYHLEDDWQDEKSIVGLAGTVALKHKVKHIEEIYPRQCKVIRKKLEKLQEFEQKNITEIDAVAGCFGELMGELFTYKQDVWEERLRKIGFYLGKFIYIMDAYDDIEKDLKEKNYNPLKSSYQEKSQDEFDQYCHGLLQMMIAESSAEFEKLPCIQDIDILRNIIYDGVWTKFNTKINKRQSVE